MSESPELSERARWYMDHFTPEQVAEMAAAQEQEVVALMAGGEPYDDETAAPTAGQWITLFNRASEEERLSMAALVLDDRARLNHYTWTERPKLERELFRLKARLAGEARAVAEAPDGHAGQDARSMLLNLLAEWGCRTGRGSRVIVDEALRRHEEELRQRRGVRASGCSRACSEHHTYADGCEQKLTVRYVGPPVRRCPSCGDTEHPVTSCEEAEAVRGPWRNWLAAAYEKAIREHADGTGSNLFGVREPEQVNGPLRFETIVALNKALEEATALRRLMVRKHKWWVEGCGVCRYPVEYCDCPDGGPAT